MAAYAYIARTPDGREVRGVLTADTEQAVLSALDEKHLFPLKVRAASGSALARMTGQTGRVPARLLGVFYSQLADLLRAGVPMLRALDVLVKQTHHKAFTAILKEVRDAVSGGEALADAMVKHPGAFSELHASMVRAGERGGFLEDVLQRIATFAERQNELRNKVIGAMVYPAFLLCLGTVIVIGVVTFFVPQFRQFLTGDKLPLPTKILFAASDALREQSLLCLMLLAGLIFGVVSLLRSETGQQWWDRKKLTMPGIGKLFRLMYVSRFCRILGTLLGNGVPVLQALRISKDSAGNLVLAQAITSAAEEVRDGAPLAEPLAESGLFPLDILDMISVGEESNNLENVLVDIADTQEKHTARMVDLVVRMIEPLILVAMAGMVMAIALSLLMPIMELTTGSLGQD